MWLRLCTMYQDVQQCVRILLRLDTSSALNLVTTSCCFYDWFDAIGPHTRITNCLSFRPQRFLSNADKTFQTCSRQQKADELFRLFCLQYFLFCPSNYLRLILECFISPNQWPEAIAFIIYKYQFVAAENDTKTSSFHCLRENFQLLRTSNARNQGFEETQEVFVWLIFARGLKHE